MAKLYDTEQAKKEVRAAAEDAIGHAVNKANMEVDRAIRRLEASAAALASLDNLELTKLVERAAFIMLDEFDPKRTLPGDGRAVTYPVNHVECLIDGQRVFFVPPRDARISNKKHRVIIAFFPVDE